MCLSDFYSMFVFAFLSKVDSMFMIVFVFDVFNVYYVGIYVFVV
jgi:hypothetical protein